MQTPKRVSCNRCKTKKIACNREYPCCDKCEAVDADCTYLPRKARAKNKSHVNNLNHPHVISDILKRLERLESRCLSREVSCEAGDSSSASPSGHLAALNDADHLRQALPERDNCSNLLFQLRYAGAPLLENEWVIDSLNDAVQKIRALQDPASQCLTGLSRPISNLDAKNWVKLFFKTYQFEGFRIPLQEDFILSIPELLENAHVSLDHTCLLIYYHVLFHGSLLDENTLSERSVLGLHLYQISVGLVEEWFDRIQNTDADLYAAISVLSTLMDFCNIELAWKMLGYACRIANALGYFTVDSLPSPYSLSPENEQSTSDRNRKRLLFWYLVRTDCMFRLHFGKPPVMEAGSWAVNMPDPTITGSDHVSSHSIQIHFLATMRLTLSMMKYLNLNAMETIQDPTDYDNTVDDLTEEIMAVLSSWEPDRLLNSAENQLDHWLSSDILFDGYKALIITQQSKCHREDERGLSAHAVSMARKSITTMKTLVDLKPQLHWGMTMILLHQVIPFAILCSNIVGASQPDEIDDDLALVNWIAEFCKVAASDRVETQPLTILVDSLHAACKRASDNTQ